VTSTAKCHEGKFDDFLSDLSGCVTKADTIVDEALLESRDTPGLLDLDNALCRALGEKVKDGKSISIYIFLPFFYLLHAMNVKKGWEGESYWIAEQLAP
jgi:hypothetical protein